MAAALLQRKQTLAPFARPAPGRCHLSTPSWCSASSAEVFPQTQELRTAWELFTAEAKLTACSSDHALCICPWQLSSSVLSNRTAHCRPRARISSIP